MAAHTFWRLFIASAEGGNFNYMSLWTLDFQDAGGSSLCLGGAPFASSQYGSLGPARVFPGGPGDWVSNNEMPCYIGYQFTGPVEPARIVLSNSNTGNNPVVMGLESSDDGLAWTREWILTKPPTWTLHAPVTYLAPTIGATSAPYWGLFVDTMDSGTGINLAEMAFLNTGGSRIPGFFNQVGAATTAGNYDWSACWDNDLNTSCWAHSQVAPGQYATAQYPAPVTAASVSVTNTNDDFYAQYIPETGGVYTSVDGLAWGLSFPISPANATGYPPVTHSSTVVWRGSAPAPTRRRPQIVNPA